MHVCLYEDIQSPGTEVTDSCDLPKWLLGIEPGTSGRMAGALHHWAISPAPKWDIVNAGRDKSTTKTWCTHLPSRTPGHRRGLAELGALGQLVLRYEAVLKFQNESL